VLLLGGSDGHDFERMKELGERYRIPSDVLLYDARKDQWSKAGTMPLGVVGAAVVATGDRWMVAGGEYSPGLRTAQVFQLHLHRKAAP
jgi:N-acetylneuraminic acid mutarotase